MVAFPGDVFTDIGNLLNNMEINWKQSKFGHMAFLGKVAIGSTAYNSVDGKATGLYYKAYCQLPGAKILGEKYPTEGQAMTAVQESVDLFFTLIK